MSLVYIISYKEIESHGKSLFYVSMVAAEVVLKFCKRKYADFWYILLRLCQRIALACLEICRIGFVLKTSFCGMPFLLRFYNIYIVVENCS